MSMDNTEDISKVWMFGLPKLWLGIVNIGAIFLICIMFYQDRKESLASAKEERILFRDAIEKLTEVSKEQSTAIRYLSIQVQKLSDRIDTHDNNNSKMKK